MHSLGNYGDTNIASLALEALSNSDPRVRSAALGTFRFLKDEQSERIILKYLTADLDSDVRNAAAYELTFREISTEGINILRKVIKNAASEVTRSTLLTVFAKNISNDQSLKSDIEFQLNNDPSEAVRLKAESILTRTN